MIPHLFLINPWREQGRWLFSGFKHHSKHGCCVIISSKYLTETPTRGAIALENIDFTCDLMTYRSFASCFLPVMCQMHEYYRDVAHIIHVAVQAKPLPTRSNAVFSLANFCLHAPVTPVTSQHLCPFSNCSRADCLLHISRGTSGFPVCSRASCIMLNGEVYPSHTAPGRLPDAEGEQIMIITLNYVIGKSNYFLINFVGQLCTCYAAFW